MESQINRKIYYVFLYNRHSEILTVCETLNDAIGFILRKYCLLELTNKKNVRTGEKIFNIFINEGWVYGADEGKGKICRDDYCIIEGEYGKEINYRALYRVEKGGLKKYYSLMDYLHFNGYVLSYQKDYNKYEGEVSGVLFIDEEFNYKGIYAPLDSFCFERFDKLI